MEPSVPSRRLEQPLRLYLLGGFRAELAGRTLQDDVWSRRSGKTLVKLLATCPTHRLHREQILDLLWPDMPPEAAGNALRKALHLARHALEPALPPRGDSAYLHLRDDVVALDPGLTWVDADHFQAVAQAALARGARDDIEHAIAAYRGDLLPEDRYADWPAARRAALADLHHALLLALATQDEQHGAYAAAVEHLRRALEREPTREDLHQRLMRDYALAGQRHQALRQYHLCREVLQTELGVDPDPDTESLYQALLAGQLSPDPRRNHPPAADRPLPLPAVARRRLTGPLVGRERELEFLTKALSQATGGHGGAVFIGGEAGVGKSRLVAEAARLAHERGALVLWGACYEHEGHLPYGPLVEALGGAVAGCEADARKRLAATCPELTDFLPALAMTPGSAPAAGPAGTDRTRLFATVVRLLDDLAGERPLMLAVDDLHAADTASLQLLHHLVRIAAERRWLVAGTFRAEDVPAGSAFQRLCAAVLRENLAHRLNLDRLSRDDCRRLVTSLLAEGAVSTEVSDQLYDRTLGNALFLHELVRAMRDQGALALAGARWALTQDEPTRVPRQISDLIIARVAHLGEDVQRTLDLAAVAGDGCAFGVLREASALAEAPLLDALDRALAAHVLEERDSGYAFRHPLVRTTLYERLSPSRRARLHVQLALAYERLPDRSPGDGGARIEALARHWAMAGEPGRAVPYLIEAADRAARVYANADAIARLNRALSLLDERPFAPLEVLANRVVVCERLGDLHALVGENDTARDRYLEAVEAAGATAAATRLRRKAAQQALFSGRLDHAERLLAQVEIDLATAEEHEPSEAERIRLVIARSQLHFLATRFDEALSAAEEALCLAEAVGSTPDIAHACEMIAMACLPLGQWRRGLEFERRHAALAEPSQALRDAADVHICLSEYHLYAEEPAESARAVLRTLKEAQRAGAPRSLALCHYYLGTMDYLRGRFLDATERLNEAVALYRRVGSRFGEGIALMVRGLAKTALGRHAEGRADLDLGVAAAEQGALRSHSLTRLHAAMGLHYFEVNDLVAARHHAELGLGLADEPSSCICSAAIHPIAAAAFAMTGDVPRAIELGERAFAQARAFRSSFFLCKSYQAAAIVHACRGAWDEAFSAFDAAQDLATKHDFPYESAKVLQYRAFVHQQRAAPGDPEAAGELMTRAGAMLQQMGVPADAV